MLTTRPPMGKLVSEVSMLCMDCPSRDLCKSPCASLEDDLEQFDYCKRETIVSPRKLEYLIESFINILDAGPDLGDDKELYLRFRLELLSEEQIEAIELRFWDNLSFSRMADKLDVSPSSAHRRYRRAMEALREMMED